ncbi:MAG: hypothetical protein ACYDEQ_01550 [Desulfocucumaceae bacterium]
MLDFVFVVILANLIMLAALYLLRHIIAIRAPVLIIAVGISIIYCISYPFIAARAAYPNVVYLYILLIMAGAGLLYYIENRFFASRELSENEITAMTAGEAIKPEEPLESVEAVAVSEENWTITAEEMEALLEDIDSHSLADSGSEHETAITQSDLPGMLEEAFVEIPADQNEAVPRQELVSIISPDINNMDNASGITEEISVNMFGIEILEEEAATLDEIDGVLVDDADMAEVDASDELEAVDEANAEGGNMWAADDDQGISGLVAHAFDSLSSGDSAVAVELFFKALKLGPQPKLAVLLCTRISSIYLSQGRKMQALCVMEMLEAVWGPRLNQGELEGIRTIIIQLRGEVE